MVEDRVDLALLKRNGLLSLFALVLGGNEPRYAGGISHDEPTLVVHLHLYEDVPGEDAA